MNYFKNLSYNNNLNNNYFDNLSKLSNFNNFNLSNANIQNNSNNDDNDDIVEIQHINVTKTGIHSDIKNAIIYCRKSTKIGPNELSLEVQQNICETFCKE